MKHALVVGGTGMLTVVPLWLVDHGYHVSVIARDASRMEQLVNKASLKKCMTTLLVDYTDEKKLQRSIRAVIKKNGNIDVVVAWIHSVAESALPIIIDEVAQKNHRWALFHILSSSSDSNRMKQKASVPENGLYYQVQLGYVVEHHHSRWLTNKEISDGIIEAIKKKTHRYIVGQLEPWENRP